jgi:hypothetical protein
VVALVVEARHGWRSPLLLPLIRFGDTVNTAARMESCGEANRIQISEATAALLVAGGMGNRVTPRDELIEAKGKGTMRVYWLEENTGRPGNRRTSLSSTIHSSVISFGMFSSSGTFNMDKSTDDLSFAIPAASVRGGISRVSSVSSKMTPPERGLESRPSLMWGASNDMLEPKLTKFRRNSSSSTQRLIDWNCHLLLRLLKQVVSKRKRKSVNLGPAFFPETEDVALRDAEKTESTLVDEVAEIISMPGFEPQDPNLPETEAVLPLAVENQLRDFVVSREITHSGPWKSHETHSSRLHCFRLPLECDRVDVPRESVPQLRTRLPCPNVHVEVAGTSGEPGRH